MLKYLGNNIAFIPVRGGSKSIPLKNIKPMLGRPLIYWTLDAAVNSQQIDKVVVSTDSVLIKNKVEKYGSQKVLVISRSEAVSTDDASTESVMLEFADIYDFNNILLLQATSPLTKTEDIDKAIKEIEKSSIESAVSLVRQKRFIWLENNSLVEPQNYKIEARPRRQEFQGFLVENGAIYTTSRKKLLKNKVRISGNIGYIEMSESTYYEIDEPSDWEIVERLLKVQLDSSIYKKKQQIKCVLVDCDGVLTDGGMYYSEFGDEMKKFNTKDAFGLRLLKDAGYVTGIITGEKSDLVKRRAEKMDVNEVHMGVSDKMQIISEIQEIYNIDLNQIAFVGDDLNDVEVIKHVGLGIAVNDAVQSVKNASDYITTASGGSGAVRELCDLLLSNNHYESV